MSTVWAGIDAGKRSHHCVVLDATGRVRLSRRVENDEGALLGLIAAVLEAADGQEVVWATDLSSGGAALLIGLLADHGQQVFYIPGRVIHHAAATYRGDGKTDAKDARIIADQARMRTDLQQVRRGSQVAVDLHVLTSARTDLVFDRVRAVNRLRATMLDYFPALEAAFDYSKKAPLILVAGHQTPDGIRRLGPARLGAWLKKRGARGAAAVAVKAVEAANAQQTTLPSQGMGAQLVARLARRIQAIDVELAELDCPASRSWQGFGLGEVGCRRASQAQVHLSGTVPREVLVRPDGVELDPEGLGFSDEVEGVVDLRAVQPLVLAQAGREVLPSQQAGLFRWRVLGNAYGPIVRHNCVFTER